MGILDLLRNEAINVIEWTDSTNNTMVHKYDTQNREIMMGAQLTVREGQEAIFVDEGQLADKFVPGRYELSTQNMPILTKIKSWKYGFNSPFKSDVYFISTRQFLDRKWGTSNPVMMRDTEFGVIRLRAFGIYAFRVTDSVAFLKEVFGTAALFTTEGVEGQLKRTIVSSLSDAIAESKIPALDLAANYGELGDYCLQVVNPKIAPLGLQLTSFVVENISLPEEVEKAMDRRTSMGVVGDLAQYTQYQAAEAMREAANNPGNGTAGIGVGLGAAAAMSQAFTQSMGGAAAAPAAPVAPTAPAAPAAPAAAGFCPECGSPLTAGAKFCSNCGAKLAVASTCPVCGQETAPGAKFCSSCGTKL